MRYFTECRTAEELKKSYKEWAKKLHPDNNGDPEEFKEMQAEFSKKWDQLKDIHMNSEGETYTKETSESAEEFMDIIETLLRLNGVQTEICGKWIWCSGNTKPHKDTLKMLGFHWAKNKNAWYYHTEPYRRRHDREYSLDEIRELYGSQQYSGQKQKDRQLKIAVM